MNNKVLLFLDSSSFGGIEAHLVELVKLLQNNNIQHTVIFYQQHGNWQLCGALKSLSCQYQFLNGNLWSFFQFLRKQHRVVIHTHGYKAGIVGRLSCRLLNIPCISTYHAGEKGVGKVRFYNWLDHITSKLSDNIVVSHHLLGNVQNSQFMANFIVPKNIKRHVKTESNNIAFVGRLSHEKGPDRFIQIAKHYEKTTALNFHIYGSGPMECGLKSQNISNVTFHGHQSDKSFWRNIDILIICSREEGLPMVLLEAMDSGVLCLCYPVGAIPRVIEHNHSGIVTKDQKQHLIINELNKMLSQSLQCKANLITNAKNQLEQSFSGKSQLKTLLELYEARG